MRTLRDIVQARLKAHGKTQQSLADALRIDSSNLSGILGGRLSAPVHRAGEWATALELSASEAAELVDAMHVANAGERVAEIIAQLEQQRDQAVEIAERYLDRIGVIRFMLDHLEPRSGGEAPRVIPSSDITLGRLVELAEELTRAAAAAREAPPTARLAEPKAAYDPIESAAQVAAAYRQVRELADRLDPKHPEIASRVRVAAISLRNVLRDLRDHDDVA